MKIDLQDHRILLTGATRGIGRAIAQLLLESGATVGIHYRTSEQSAAQFARDFPLQCSLHQEDLSQPGAAGRLVSSFLDAWKGIECLINNAGIAISQTPAPDSPTWTETWQHTLQVNLVAAAEATESALPYFVDAQNGRIIHIASRAAFRGDKPEYAAYAASKGGLVAYSKSIARGFGKQGIKSFVVAPGFTRTDMASQFIETYGEEIIQHDLALSHVTEPEDIAPTVLCLASGMMDHATGSTIDLNAGSYIR